MSYLRQIVGIRKNERPFAYLMGLYFFLVISSFWILKPLKKGLFIDWYDQSGGVFWGMALSAAQLELLAKGLNMAVAMLAVVVFSLLVRNFRRQRLTYVFSGFFIVATVWFSRAMAQMSVVDVWVFYLLGDLYSTLMVATFFAYLNDSVNPIQARRLYGVVGLGGVLGGVFGTMVVRAWIAHLNAGSWLIVVAILTGLIALIAFAASRAQRKVAEEKTDPTPGEGLGSALEDALAGAKMVFHSRYMLSIAGIVLCYEIVSTIFDFQFSATVAHYLDGMALKEHFATIYLITAIVAVFVQLFLTNYTMRRLGVGTALLVLPAAMLLGSAAFAVMPILWVGSLLNTADNGFSYSINQSAKEALYVPLSRDEKYKAKAFIDMFGQRFAKVLAALLSLGITAVITSLAGMRVLSIIAVALIAVWLVLVKNAGSGFMNRSVNQHYPARKDAEAPA